MSLRKHSVHQGSSEDGKDDASKDASKFKKPRLKKPIPLLEGFRNVLPQEEGYWSWIRSRFEALARDYDFQWIGLPLLEALPLYHRAGASPQTFLDEDLIEFEDQKKNLVVLRPDATAQLGRAYVEHAMMNLPQPVKFFYEGPFFHRHPVWGGRLDQFHVAGVMSIGDDHPVLDAELILFGSSLFAECGLGVTIQINSLGCLECRPSYLQLLREYYRSRKKFLCEACKGRYAKAPLELGLCENVDCRELAQDAPQFIDHLCEPCRTNFVSVLEHLDESELSYVLNPKLIAGADFYNRTVFEIWTEEQPNQPPLTMLFGGRHDHLIENLGGEPTPAVSFQFGMERFVQALKDRGIRPQRVIQKDVFLAQLGDSAKKKSLKLFNDLRRQGMKVSASLSKDGLREQLVIGAKHEVKFTIIIGQKEIIDGTALLRDMLDGSQEVIDFQKIVPTIQKRLGSKMLIEKNLKLDSEQRSEAEVKTKGDKDVIEPSGPEEDEPVSKEVYSIGIHEERRPPDEIFDEEEDPISTALSGNSEREEPEDTKLFHSDE